MKTPSTEGVKALAAGTNDRTSSLRITLTELQPVKLIKLIDARKASVSAVLVSDFLIDLGVGVTVDFGSAQPSA